jgi:endonuclease YncB( thermonuclease family)
MDGGRSFPRRDGDADLTHGIQISLTPCCRDRRKSGLSPGRPERKPDAVRRIGTFTSLLVLCGGALVAFLLSRPEQQAVTGVAEAIDGDSLRIAGEEIRLKGIDAPELQQTCKAGARDEPCGRAARAALRRHLATGLVTCVTEGRDRYGRRLALCRARGMDINAAMVRDGQAVGYGAYAAEEGEARLAYRGIWAGTFERPAEWRERQARGAPAR